MRSDSQSKCPSSAVDGGNLPKPGARRIQALVCQLSTATFCGSTGGSVNRKNGSDATVDISESKNGDPGKAFTIQVAALSWAATQVPEIAVAIQSFLKAGFLSAVQVELSFIFEAFHPVTKAGRSRSFRKFCS